MSKPYRALDPLIHQPARLSILAALAVAEDVEFSAMRDTLQISDSLLSRYTAMLEQAGYITIRKTFKGKRASTWFALTPQGRNAFTKHVALLKQIIEPGPYNKTCLN